MARVFALILGFIGVVVAFTINLLYASRGSIDFN
jgi:hypothetical protein